MVLEPELRDLHGCVVRDEDRELLQETVTLAYVLRVAGAVAHVGFAVAAREGRRRPNRRGLLVSQVERFRRGIEDRIVSPGREAILAAVAGPGAAERRLA